MKALTPIILSSLLSALLAVALYRMVLPPTVQITESTYPASYAKLDDYLIGQHRSAYLSSAPTDFIQASQGSTPAVVFITARRIKDRDFMGTTRYAQSTGSGVIISPGGYIVTNNHVIEDGTNITVTLNDNREYKAEIIGTDPTTDLALLKIEEQELPFLIFGNSDQLQVGEWVLAVGNPFRLQSTVTAGIVSAKGRSINIVRERYGIESFIQTDAVVNPGNSGGALVNTAGELIGINTAILTMSGQFEGYSFAVPANLVQKIVRDLKEYGSVQRGLLGVNIVSVDANIADQLDLPEVSGVYVSRVNRGTGAADAGLRENDVITAINGKRVKNVPALQEQVARYRPGDRIEVDIWRQGQSQKATVTLKNYVNTTDIIASENSSVLQRLGMEVRELSSKETRSLREDGIIVMSIYRGSTIDRTNMEPDFIITKANDRSVISVRDLIDAIQDAQETVILEGYYQRHEGSYWYTFDKNN